MNSDTLSQVTAALAPTKLILAAEYNRQFQTQFSKFCAQLEADGMDAEKSFHYPRSSNMSRNAYLMQQARYNYMTRHSKGVLASRPMNAPDIRTVDEDETRPKFTVQAVKEAAASLAGFCHKLSAKIDAELKETDDTVRNIVYQGGMDPWGWSYVTVHTGKVSQVWKTRMIVNVSCLGKVFNQWPTRRVQFID